MNSLRRAARQAESQNARRQAAHRTPRLLPECAQ
jgi:hypothetical protein